MGCIMAVNNLVVPSKKIICERNSIDFALKENALL